MLLYLSIALLLLTLVKGQQPINLPIEGVRLYLPYEDRVIPDYSMIYASQFYNIDQNHDPNNINDALWCQSANNDANIGVWYYPNGNEVPLFDGPFDNSSAPSPVFSKRFSGQIALARNGGLSGYEGLYKCIIPDKNGVNQTLVVGAYTDTGYNNNDGPDADPTMQFSLLSTSRLDTPPVFSLSFNVSNGPPTTVYCSVNGNGISTELSREIVNGPGSVTRVTVTVKLREAGNYQCTVSNDRVSAGTINGITALNSSSSMNITVPSTPTNFTAKRSSSGLTHVIFSWSPANEANGYDVYYNSSSSNSQTLLLITTSNTSTLLTSNLTLGSTYTFYVVSYTTTGPSLPSDSSFFTLKLSIPIIYDIIITNITSTDATLSWKPTVEPIGYDIERRCHRLCNKNYISFYSISSFSSIYRSSGMSPYSQCKFIVFGVYGNESVNLSSSISFTTLSTAPTASIANFTLLSVESVSMTISWDEVPCNGRNGPITGYYLTYTNITSNTSYTVNITGKDNRMYNLTGLIPHTNYTVSILAYTIDGLGPSEFMTQETDESIPGMIYNLMSDNIDVEMINISWNPPTIPNGIITVYEIRYRESTSTDPYNITNTSNTYYSIVELIPNTSYTIGVRAYTSIGPGEWTQRNFTTDNERKSILYSTSISPEIYTSPSPLHTTPFAFGLYGALFLLAVSLILNIILIITLCCKKSSVKRKDSTPLPSPPARNPDTDDYIPMGSNSVCFELRSNEPVYNVIDQRTIEPIYSLPSNIDKPHDSHLTTDTEYHLVTEEKSETMPSGEYPDQVLPGRSHENQFYVKMDTQEKDAPCNDDGSHFYY